MSNKNRTFTPKPLMSYLAVGCVSAVAALMLPFLGSIVGTVGALLFVAISILVSAVVAGRYEQIRITDGLASLVDAVVTGEKPTGTSEFDHATTEVVGHISRLALVAAKGREQSREVEVVLESFDRRGARDSALSPARQLTLMLNSLGAEAQEAIQQITAVGEELDAARSELLSDVTSEGELVRDAAVDVEKLARDGCEISNHARDAKTFDVHTYDSAESVSRQLMSLQQQIEGLRDHVSNCERKSQLLRDQSSEISTLMRAIHEHSTQTDTMALNASIESVRAGEHGLGFASAADEIRRLTSLISDSARDALDRLQLVEANIHDAGNICTQSRTNVELQLNTTRELAQSMSEIRQTTSQSRDHLDQVLQLNDTQLQNVNSVADSLRNMFTLTNRSSTQHEQDISKRLEFTDRLARLTTLLEPLCRPVTVKSSSPVIAEANVEEAVGHTEPLSTTA